MRIFGVSLPAVAGVALLFPSFVLSAPTPHGGTYRSPVDSGPGGPATPRDNSSSAPSGCPTPNPPSSDSSNSEQTTPQPVTPGPRGAHGTRGGRGVSVHSSESEWQVWWEFNRDRYLGLKHAIYSMDPARGDGGILGRGAAAARPVLLVPSDLDRKRIATTMTDLLDQNPSRDIASSALIGLARVDSTAHGLSVLRRYLRDTDQEKRETAALAMGISGNVAAVANLLDLAKDTEAGRRLVNRAEVDYRTRSFACYALGLICQKTANQRIQLQVFTEMRALIDQGIGKATRHALLVAPLQAIRLLRPDADLRDDAVAFLLRFMDLGDDVVYANIRSHAYVAIAKLLGRDAPKSAEVARLMAERLADRKQRAWVHQSAILALAKIASPDQEKVGEVLRWYFEHGKDLQARGFAAIALGEIAGAKNRAFLLQQIRHGKKLLRPWVALGLGVLDFDNQIAHSGDSDAVIGSSIHQEFLETKNQMSAAALAIALGICRYREAADDILERFEQNKHQSLAAGYMAVSLGLIGRRNPSTIEAIKEVLEQSARRPYLLGKCAIALGLLGDKNIAVQLAKRIREPHTVAVYGALASGLGAIGDRRSIASLVAMAENDQLKTLPRAFAVVALGLVGDTRPLPWNSDLAIDNNYRANVETLTGGQAGVLDIL